VALALHFKVVLSQTALPTQEFGSAAQLPPTATMGAQVDGVVELQYRLSSSKQIAVGSLGELSRSNVQKSWGLTQLVVQGSPALPRAGAWQTPVTVGSFAFPVHTHSSAPPPELHSLIPDTMGMPPTPQGAPSTCFPTNTPLHAVTTGLIVQVVAVWL
jgi:hypothetical protein